MPTYFFNTCVTPVIKDFGFNACTISLLFSRIGLMIYPINTLVKIWVTRDATAAPFSPQIGIKIALSITFVSAPQRFMIHKRCCFPSDKIQISLTEPM